MQSDIGNHNCSRCRTSRDESPSPRKANCAACMNNIHPAMQRIWVQNKDFLGQCYFFGKLRRRVLNDPRRFERTLLHRISTKAQPKPPSGRSSISVSRLGIWALVIVPVGIHRPTLITFMQSPSDVCHFSEIGWLRLPLPPCSAMLFDTSARTSSTSPKSIWVVDVSKTCLNKTCLNLFNPMRTASKFSHVRNWNLIKLLLN